MSYVIFDHSETLGTSGVRRVYRYEHGRNFEVLATTVGHSSVTAFSVRKFIFNYGECINLVVVFLHRPAVLRRYQKDVYLCSCHRFAVVKCVTRVPLPPGQS